MRRALGVLLAIAILTACSGDDDDAVEPTESSTVEATAEPASDAVDEGARTRAESADGSLVARVDLDPSRARHRRRRAHHGLGSGEAEATITSNGDDVSSQFVDTPDGWIGLVDGLNDGENEIVATAGDESVTLVVTNHSKNGPVFSGPHLEPWVCKTEEAGLGAPLDEDCDAPSKVTYSYQSTDGSLKPLDDPITRPADLATTTIDGEAVPFIVRTEQGVINRGIYTIWVLDPNAGGGFWDGTRWNERLVFRFGGGCGTTYSQGSSFVGNADVGLLGQGYAVATNTLDTFQTACNDTLSAETALMTREYFIEQLRHSSVHDRRRRLRRRDPTADDRAPLPGNPRRALAERSVPRCHLDLRWCDRLPSARELLRLGVRQRRSPTSRSARSTVKPARGPARVGTRCSSTRPSRLSAATLRSTTRSTTPTRDPTAFAARFRTSTSTSSGATRRRVSPTGRSTMSGSSTAWWR